MPASPAELRLAVESADRAPPPAIAIVQLGRPAVRDLAGVSVLQGTDAVDLGWFFVVFGAFVIVGAGNAVNLTDGLDGLAIVPGDDRGG